MKKILILIILLNSYWISAQIQDPKVSLSFENATLKEVFQQLEAKTDLQFFYVQEWLGDQTVSGEYDNASVEDILDDILENTILNYYVLNEVRVILTQNNVIYEELPEGFFPETEEEAEVVANPEENITANPVFSGQNRNAENRRLQTIHIGREDRNSSSRFFTLEGQVTDAETGRPLSQVVIMVQDNNINDVTDDQGRYEIRLPAGENILQTQSLGTEEYRRKVVIYNDGELDISLRESYEQLGEVLLESDSDKNVKTAMTGVEEINIEEIKNIPLVLGERDILKVATTLPGISTAGEGSAGYNVRGGRADQNLILLDDAVIYNPSHFFGIFSGINPFTSGEVNIYKGSIPAEFGGRLSSVFEISTKDANLEQFAGEASVGPVTSNIALEIPVIKEKSGILVGARSTYSNWILRSLDDESLQDSKASFYDIVAKYNHIINDRSEIETTAYFSHDNFSITSDSTYSYNNRLFSVRYNRELNDKNRGSLILSNSGYRFNIDYESDFSNNFTSVYDLNETEIKLNMDYSHSSQHQFSYGIASKLYLINPGTIEPLGSSSIVDPFSIPREKGLESAIFIADDYKINDRFLVNAGIRYSFYAALGEGTVNVYEPGLPREESTVRGTEEYDNFEVMETYGGPELRLSARYFLLPTLSAKVSYNNTYQYIHTLTNNTTMSPTDTYKLSGVHIEPQRANQFSAGLYKNFQQNMYELSVEGFYKNMDNMMDFKVGADLFLNQDIETEVLQGQGKSYGGEFLLKKTKGKLNGWIGYSYTRSLIKLDSEFSSERINNGEYFPSNFDKPHDLSVIANYKLTKRFSFSANFIYQTGRPVTYPIGKYNFNGAEYVFYSDRNKYRIPDYYRLDLSFNVEGNHRNDKIAHSFWNISIYNVLGRNNPYSVFFVTDEGEVKAFQSSIFAIPIPTITYNIKF